MSKQRVYELAKELNTSSKRLMEKLTEIKIDVKNHMSLLEEHELSALFKHIGIVKKDGPIKEKIEVNVEPVKPAKVDMTKEEKKKKSEPRIIRKTEIVIDTDPGSPLDIKKKNDDEFNKKNGEKNKDMVKKEDSHSGLRPGFIRDSEKEIPKNKQIQDELVNDKAKPEKSLKKKTEDVGKTEVLQETVRNTQPESIIESSKKHENDITEEAHKRDTNIGENVSQGENSTARQINQTQENRTGAQGNRPSSVQGSRPANYQGNKPSNYQGNRPSNYQGNKPSNYQGNKPSTSQDGKPSSYQGNRPSNSQDGRSSSYQGNKPSNSQDGRSSSYQGNKPSNSQDGRTSNYQGNKPSNFQGSRPSNYQGNKPSNFQGNSSSNYQGNKPNNATGEQRKFTDSRNSGQNRTADGDRGFNRQGNRPGDRPGGQRPNGPRPYPSQGAQSKTKLEIPKSEVDTKQEELSSMKMENKRVTAIKDYEKEAKKELRKEKTVGTPKGDKFVGANSIVGQKKGVSEVLSEDFILNEFYKDDKVKKTNKNKRPYRQDSRYQRAPEKPYHKAVLTQITIGETITVKELAESLKKTSTEVIKKLMNLGVMATLNQELDYDTSVLIGEEFSIKVDKAVVVTAEEILFDETEDSIENLEVRPPVVVVMGHVDHGKTSLLDAIRSTNVTDSEAGGITQHIGAYTVKINGKNITFLDTPGHEAFTAMRARGAQITDVAILVVAADDGVMPQTVEAINHAKAANVTVIVAINKMDKPGANIDRVKQELAQHGLVTEEWGGDTICVNVSAKLRENIDTLLEMVLLSADILELKANPNRQAKGTVIEAKLDKDRGTIATMLVQRGTLNVGDTIVTGTTVGRIRAMADDKGNKIKNAGPSTPVEILGLPEVPESGEEFYAITDEKLAKQLAEKRRFKAREQVFKAQTRVTLDDLFVQIKAGKVKDLNIIVKADVHGSVEAVTKSLEKLTNDEVRTKIIHGAVGAINESDVTLAQVSNAIIIGFNVRPSVMVSELAKNLGVDLRLYRVIYKAIEDIEAAMKGMLEPTFKEVILGHIEVRQIFKASGIGTIGGGYVIDGKVTRNSEIRIVRDGVVVHEGKLASLKRFKDDAKEVQQGFECGVLIEKFNDIRSGDVVESYVMEEVAR